MRMDSRVGEETIGKWVLETVSTQALRSLC